MFDNLTGRQDSSAEASAAAAVVASPTEPVISAAIAAPDAQTTVTNTPPTDGAPQGTAPAVAPVDHYSFLDKMSEGLIKDEEGFKAALPKIKEYGTLKEKHDELAAKMAQAPVFADDEVRILNDLKRAGATKEQIKNFQKINEYGSIAEMSDKDALVAALVMKGTKQSTAELKVERDFKLSNEDLDPAERELLDDDLRIASLDARKELEGIKATASTVSDAQPEEVQLQLQAKTLAHQAAVKPYVSEIISALPHLGEFTLSAAKEGADAVKFSLPIDDSAKAEISQSVQNYFMDGLVQVTPENTIEAMAYARAEYFRTHAEQIFQSIYNQGVSKTTEQLVNKYENRSGLRPQTDAPQVHGANDAAATAKFVTNMVNRQL